MPEAQDELKQGGRRRDARHPGHDRKLRADGTLRTLFLAIADPCDIWIERIVIQPRLT